MNAKHVELLQRLEQFQLDSPGASLPFSARLARENNWAPDYARRVITEYKRFAFLAIGAGHPVSPSEDVDQAWHLHLTYSENYWKHFCPEVLGQSFHHQPTRGGKTESEKFNDWYARTLQSYETFFNEPAPADIWPSPEARQKEKHHFVRVDRERSWVIPKPQLKLNPTYAIWCALLTITVLCSGAMFAQGFNVFDWRGPDFLGFYLVLFPVCFGIALWLRWKWCVPVFENTLLTPKLDGYATAYLNGGPILAVNTAVANLINQKVLRVDPKSRQVLRTATHPKLAHDLEHAVFAAAISKSGKTVAEIRSAVKPSVASIAKDLQAKGLVVSDTTAAKVRAFPLLIPLAAVAIGLIKIFVGISRERPVSFLVVLCFLSAGISFLMLLRRPLRSRYGNSVLKKLREQHTGPRLLGRNVKNVSSTDFATAMGLFGMSALVGPDLTDFRNALHPPPKEGGWSGCGGSSSSCGGGSSCGGASSCGGGGSSCGSGCRLRRRRALISFKLPSTGKHSSGSVFREFCDYTF